ncbi:hypothetical protein GOB94_09155 [Granulicella sp. 5B5]|uniref:hypothetical protein n=1 Tax=Granulicella sp. 5B5 TaxID=1617967 RepID=UPI0015F6B787|nr:hypothetical protein [Granulicella sp. 5B5]QMV18832.1 hypothetical protein GOB94_09155 [Granulicella sp. 5B5]
MTKIFSEVVKGFEWLGKKVTGAAGEIGKVIAITSDVESDAQTLLPEVVTVIDDVGAFTGAMVKDGGAAFTQLRLLSVAVLAAYAAKGMNFADDAAVLSALKSFGETVMAHGTWLDVITDGEKLATDFDKLGSSAAAALQKLNADA